VFSRRTTLALAACDGVRLTSSAAADAVSAAKRAAAVAATAVIMLSHEPKAKRADCDELGNCLTVDSSGNQNITHILKEPPAGKFFKLCLLFNYCHG
jgi:hypothetical protein